LILPEGDVEHPAQTVSMAQWARAAAVKAWAVRRRDEMEQRGSVLTPPSRSMLVSVMAMVLRPLKRGSSG
jgi:hypothetical protein